jgi:hypothetical protein
MILFLVFNLLFIESFRFSPKSKRYTSKLKFENDNPASIKDFFTQGSVGNVLGDASLSKKIFDGSGIIIFKL